MGSGLVEGFIAGLREVPGTDRVEEGRARMRSLIHLLDKYRREGELDKETVQALMSDMHTYYFQGSYGAFWMARSLRCELEEYEKIIPKIRSKITSALISISTLMCRDLDTAAQSGHIAGGSMEIAYWVAEQIHHLDPIAAARLMRTCGKQMSGQFMDDFFWRLKVDQARDYNLLWAIRPLSEGMLANEGTVDILACYLRRKDRGPKVSRQHVEEVRAHQEKARLRMEEFRARQAGTHSAAEQPAATAKA